MTEKKQTIRDFANENKGLLFIVANPMTDEVYMTFNGKEARYKFPENENFIDNITFQVLNEGTFHFAIDAFLNGLKDALGIKSKGNKIKGAAASLLGLVDGFIFNATKEKVDRPVEKKKAIKK